MNSLRKVTGKLDDYIQTLNGAENHQSYPSPMKDGVLELGDTDYGYAVASISDPHFKVWMLYIDSNWVYV